MDKQNYAEEYIELFSKRAADIRLPRWDELPDIGLYMDQVITMTNKYIQSVSAEKDNMLTSSMINNYVKKGIIPAPLKKKYSRTHISRLLIICFLKPVMAIQDIGFLIDNMLKTKTDGEILDFFASHYERTFSEVSEMIVTSSDTKLSDRELMLTAAVMDAAAISGGSKLLAQSALSELEKISCSGSSIRERYAEKKGREKIRQGSDTDVI